MTRAVAEQPGKVLKGIGLSAAGYAAFAMQDAAAKWLAASYPVAEILFFRSLVIVAIALAIGRTQVVFDTINSRNKVALTVRAALILAAWLLFYSASPKLGLAEITTLYFAAPIIAVCLSALVLKERVDAPRWLAVLGGFVGVVVAANPRGHMDLGPVMEVLIAAACWGVSVMLARWISRSESTVSQMLASNGLFALACAVGLVWLWRTPSAFDLGLMLAIGAIGGLGQYLVFEAFKLAPAAVVAPIEYTGLIWAFLNGWFIWRDVPTPNVFVGAALIAASSLVMIWFEGWRRGRGRGAVRSS